MLIRAILVFWVTITEIGVPRFVVLKKLILTVRVSRAIVVKPRCFVVDSELLSHVLQSMSGAVYVPR